MWSSQFAAQAEVTARGLDFEGLEAFLDGRGRVELAVDGGETDLQFRVQIEPLLSRRDLNHADRNVLASFEPAGLAESPTSLQVGLAAIRVPQSYVLVEAAVVGQESASEGVRVEIARGPETCTVTSTYFGIDGPTFDEPVEETTARNPNGPVAWHRSADERVWQTAATDSDLFQFECQDPAVARFLAETVHVPT